MKQHMLFLIIPILLTFSCNEDAPCDDSDWLDSEIETLEESDLSQYFYITQATYKNIPVFIMKNCCPNCLTTPPPVYNCSGFLLGYIGDEIDSDQLKNEKIFWQSGDFSCPVS